MLGTNQGVRIAIADDNANLSYGPIIVPVTGNVYAFTARNEFVFAGVKSYIGGASGLVRINLGQPLQSGGYAWAKDVYAVETTGSVWAIATTPTGRKAFTVENSGLWIESASNLVESGEITTGIIRYETLENKAWKRLKIRTESALQGSIDIFRVVDGLASSFRTVVEGSTTDYDYDLSSVFNDVNVEAQFKFRLNRNSTTATTGAVMAGYSVKALPTPTRARLIQFPLFCFDSERDRLKNIMGYQGYALNRLQALEQMEALGETVIIQDFTANGEPTEAIIDQVSFTRTTPPNGNFTGWGGIIQITARTVV
jgi:hypothetical protein